MTIEQKKWTVKEGWQWQGSKQLTQPPQLVLAFGSRRVLTEAQRFQELRNMYPKANIVCASTAGEILDCRVLEDSLVVTAIHFEKTMIRVVSTKVNDRFTSFNAGRNITEQLLGEDLSHVLVLSDGQLVNGSELVNGLNHENKLAVPVTGGLAGDGARFEHTLVGANNVPAEGNVVAIGFYGKHLKVGHGSNGGWDPFGPERTVTRAINNVLYELDHENALQLYKKYLGTRANELPGAALLFPLCINVPDSNEVLVRTVLSIDEGNQTMTFAGDIPEGSGVRLMKANFERLIDAATDAADNSLHALGSFQAELAILISCVGRKLVLSHRAEEEVEEAIKVFGPQTRVTGFYSYGEISPLVSSATCELHNQTMTITTYREE